MIKEDVRGD